VAPFRRAQFRVAGRLAQSYAEHDRVVAAILQGDAEAAAEAMRSHLSNVRDASEGYRQQRSG
jgi:DNA-binding FadR family transcriptional regulator